MLYKPAQRHRMTHFAVLHWLWERERAVVPALRHGFDETSAVGTATDARAAVLCCDVEHARDFVERFADRVIERVSQELVVANALVADTVERRE